MVLIAKSTCARTLGCVASGCRNALRSHKLQREPSRRKDAEDALIPGATKRKPRWHVNSEAPGLGQAYGMSGRAQQLQKPYTDVGGHLATMIEHPWALRNLHCEVQSATLLGESGRRWRRMAGYGCQQAERNLALDPRESWPVRYMFPDACCGATARSGHIDPRHRTTADSCSWPYAGCPSPRKQDGRLSAISKMERKGAGVESSQSHRRTDAGRYARLQNSIDGSSR